MWCSKMAKMAHLFRDPLQDLRKPPKPSRLALALLENRLKRVPGFRGY